MGGFGAEENLRAPGLPAPDARHRLCEPAQGEAADRGHFAQHQRLEAVGQRNGTGTDQTPPQPLPRQSSDQAPVREKGRGTNQPIGGRDSAEGGVSLTLVFPRRRRLIVSVASFLPVSVVFGSPPFCFRPGERQDLSESEVFEPLTLPPPANRQRAASTPPFGHIRGSLPVPVSQVRPDVGHRTFWPSQRHTSSRCRASSTSNAAGVSESTSSTARSLPERSSTGTTISDRVELAQARW